MYTVGVVGLGKIAAMYGNPDEEAPYCHVGGIRHSDRVRLASAADVSAEQTAAFRERWGACFPDLNYRASFAEMWEADAPDIVAVCVRGPHHFEMMMDVIAAGPKAIFLEKPPSCSLQQADTMIASAKAKGIPITVSYSRHWCPHVLRMQELILGEGIIGDVKQVVAHTGGSFLSFTSHVTDLVCQFAGYDARAITARGHAGREAPEGFESEPELDGAILEFESGILGIHSGVEGEYGGFYVDVIGENGYARAGIYTPPFAKTKDGPIDLDTLGMPPAASVFQVAYEQIADHLDGGPIPHCTDEDWHVVNELGFAGIESMLTGERVELPNTNRTRLIYANG